MRVQRTRTKQLHAPLTTTLWYPENTQCNFNSCSFNSWLDYIVLGLSWKFLLWWPIVSQKKLLRRSCRNLLHRWRCYMDGWNAHNTVCHAKHYEHFTHLKKLWTVTIQYYKNLINNFSAITNKFHAWCAPDTYRAYHKIALQRTVRVPAPHSYLQCM